MHNRIHTSFCVRIIDHMDNENSDDTMFRVIDIVFQSLESLSIDIILYN